MPQGYLTLEKLLHVSDQFFVAGSPWREYPQALGDWNVDETPPAFQTLERCPRSHTWKRATVECQRVKGVDIKLEDSD
jgi:hypothetical protein